MINLKAKSHPKYEYFVNRFLQAIYREKFKRSEKENTVNNTPISTIDSNKYIVEIEGKLIFILAPNKLFEELIILVREICKAKPRKQYGANELLEYLYEYKDFKDLFTNWEYYSWTSSLELFKEHLREESFFYFDDGEDQYYFPLFRQIDGKDKSEFTGGFLHFLVKHFEHFNNFHFDSNDKNFFFYNTHINNLIKTAISKEIKEGNKKNTCNKSIMITDINKKTKMAKIGLYFDELKNLWFVNTFHLESIK